ncbi:hypothetical protein [Aeromicrobium terrae]|uniref:Uncharacterized protein n=1 Tax=Aeromicrobium terrae TaxID=2498846 RepID=A0A5C8NLY2_9ACTN|nr:hypothetical protein [Aeromicrobium terrae]TXL61483.1 hypothetical protein FHP06_08650 [Aeromicrobium terrae]
MSTEIVDGVDRTGAALPAGTVAPSSFPQTARAALAQRVLVVSGNDALRTAPLVSVDTSGLVVSGADAGKIVRQLRLAHSDMTLLVDPTSHGTVATPEAPFDLGPQDGLFDQTIDDLLDGQRGSGASVAVTPSKFIAAGDIRSLKGLLAAANGIEREDVLVLMALAPQFMAPEHVATVIAVAKRIHHPVALTLGSQTNPLTSRHRIEGYRRFFGEVEDAVAWRTDLAGFGAMARGAAAAAIGQLPSLRRVNEPNKNGRAQRPQEKFPHVLIPSLLRFGRTNVMQEKWFASSTPWKCDCAVCKGRDIDKFSGSPTDRLAAHLHNAAVVQELHAAAQDDPSGVDSWWVSRLRQAQIAHDLLSGQTGVKVPVPDELQIWMSVDGA